LGICALIPSLAEESLINMEIRIEIRMRYGQYQYDYLRGPYQ
jgi:hypothetical protein